MSPQWEGAVLVRLARGLILAATALILFQLQTYLTISGWSLAMAFGMLGTMHSTERVARLGLSILIVLVLMPPSFMDGVARWLSAIRSGSAL